MTHFHQFIILTIIWLFYTEVQVFWNYDLIKNKKSPVHWFNFVLGLAVCGILCWLFNYSIGFIITAFIYCGCIYSALFNFHLNKLRRLAWDYLGEGSVIDRIEASMKNPEMALGIKLILALMASFVLMDLPNPWA